MALLRGTLDVMVLKALSWGPMHGFEIVNWLEDRSGGRLDVQDAALIQSLHRMEERSLIEAEWGITKNGRKARYYRLTADGRASLKASAADLREDMRVVAAILDASRS